MFSFFRWNILNVLISFTTLKTLKYHSHVPLTDMNVCGVKQPWTWNVCDNNYSRPTFLWSSLFSFSIWSANFISTKGVRFGPKVGQIDLKWDKSGPFQIRFQYILALRAKMYWNLISINPALICPILGLSNPLNLTWHSWSRMYWAV